MGLLENSMIREITQYCVLLINKKICSLIYKPIYRSSAVSTVFILNSYKTDEDNSLELDEDVKTATEVCICADHIDVNEQVSFIPEQSPAEGAVHLYEFLELSQKLAVVTVVSEMVLCVYPSFPRKSRILSGINF